MATTNHRPVQIHHNQNQVRFELNTPNDYDVSFRAREGHAGHIVVWKIAFQLF